MTDRVEQAGTPEVGLLGGLRVRAGDGSVLPTDALRTAKTRHLLRLLALHVNQAVPVDTLLEALWPEAPAQRARASLRTAASQLRRSFAEDRLVRVGEALMLRDVEVDVDAFRRTAERALRCYDRRDLLVGCHHARQAFTLYRGDLAEDEPYLEALQDVTAQLTLQHHHLVVETANAALQLGHLQQAIGLAERALVADATSERACETLVRGLARLGERAAALRTYERCRRELAEELGIEPSAALRALHRELLVDTSMTMSRAPRVGVGAAAF